MNHQEILNKHKTLTSLKGPRPHLKAVGELVTKHGPRLSVNELNDAIAKLTQTRNENQQFEVAVKQALADQAMEVAKAAAAAVAPVAETVAA